MLDFVLFSFGSLLLCLWQPYLGCFALMAVVFLWIPFGCFFPVVLLLESRRRGPNPGLCQGFLEAKVGMIL